MCYSIFSLLTIHYYIRSHSLGGQCWIILSFRQYDYLHSVYYLLMCVQCSYRVWSIRIRRKTFLKTCIFNSPHHCARGVIELRVTLTTCLTNPRMYGSIFGIDPVSHILQYNDRNKKKKKKKPVMQIFNLTL